MIQFITNNRQFSQKIQLCSKISDTRNYKRSLTLVMNEIVQNCINMYRNVIIYFKLNFLNKLSVMGHKLHIILFN